MESTKHRAKSTQLVIRLPDRLSVHMELMASEGPHFHLSLSRSTRLASPARVDLQQSEFLADPVDSFRLTLLVLVDDEQSNLNLVFRMAPMVGEGLAGYRIVSRTGEDEYSCFGY